MGSSTVGKCDCGFETEELLLGGGMMNFDTVCLFPHYCQNCTSLFNENIYNKDLICPKCKSKNVISYDDKRACSFMKDEVFSWNTQSNLGRDLKLSADNNLCPKCGSFTLNFMPSLLLWD